MIRASIRRPITVSMAYLTIAFLGVVAWQNIPLELLPDTSLPRLTVSATWAGASPEVTEAFLTSPLEAEIQQVRGVEKIESTSQEQNGQGQASIQVEFNRDTDMDFARLELSERIGAMEDRLPVGVNPTIQQYVPDEFQRQSQPLLQYTVTGPYTLEALRQHVDDVIKPELQQIPGVGEIYVYGGRARVLDLELDEKKIQALGLRTTDVSARVRNMEIVKEAGAVLSPDGILRTLAIRERPESAEDVRQLALLVDHGRLVRVGDVAKVTQTYEEPNSYYRINGNPAVQFFIQKGFRTNAVQVADRVKARLAELDREHAHPSGVHLILDRDESKDIRSQLSDLRTRALISAAVVLLVLLLFLLSVRAAVIVFATVAFAILITLNVIYFSGMTLNLLTLMGLAMGFGLVVDNAIVVLENIYRRRKLGEAADVAAERGAREVVLPILAATGTTVIVVVPFVYLQGELRVYYVPLAIVLGISLVASLFVAFTFIPSLGARLLSRIRTIPGLGTARGAAPGTATPGSTGAAAADAEVVHESVIRAQEASWIARLYTGVIRGTLRFPWVTVVLSLALLGGSYHLFNKYVTRGVVWGNWGFGEDTYIDVYIQQPRGEELERTDELARYFEARLKEMPEVKQFTSNVSPLSARIHITFPDSIEHTSVPVAIKEQMVQYSLLFGGTVVHVYGYGPSFYGGGSSPPSYNIKILGYNYEQVRAIAEDLGQRLQRFSRIRDVDTNSSGYYYNQDKATEMVLDIDRHRLALHNLTAADVVAQVRAAVMGRNQRNSVRVGGEELQLEVKLSGYRNMSVLQLQELQIPGPTGEAVRLGDVATIRERNVLNRVVRENQQYQRVVAYEFRGPPKLGDRVKDAVVKATRLPPGYTIEDQQSWYFSTEEKQQIYGVLAVSVILIFMLTAALFESIRQPLTVLLTVPMALIGVFLIFFYRGATFTREAYVGVIMMGGIVVNNAILLVDHVNQLRRREGLRLKDAVVRGSIERVRPILMTSLTTICGLLPLVLFSETVDSNIWNALGYALIGGLTSSTVMVLTVTPSLYLIFERRGERKAVAAAAAGASTTTTNAAPAH